MLKSTSFVKEARRTLSQSYTNKIIKIAIILFICNFISIHYVFADDYYWVAGSGNWSELNHWATSSGGSVFHSSVPDYDDNVIFDANSFAGSTNTVTIDVENAVCRDFSFAALTQNLKFDGGGELHVYGSMVLNPLVDFLFSGAVIFQAKNSDQVLISENKTFHGNVTFKGVSGNWNVTGNLICSKSITIKTHNATFICNQVEVAEDFILSGNNTNITCNGLVDAENFYLLGTNSALSTGSIHCKSAFVYDGEFNLGGELLATNEFYITGGAFNSNGYDVSFTNGFITGACIADLSNSNINVANRLSISGATSNLTSTNTSLFFSGSSNLQLNAEPIVNFATVNFENTGTINCNNSNIQSVLFKGDGTIDGDGNTLGTVEFQKNGKINGSNQFTNLGLAANYQYRFKAGTTQTISGNLSASGTCREHIILKSNTENIQASISKASGTCNIDYALLEDMDFTGGATFQSARYVNIKNTTGITGNSQAQRTLYWVGGSGNWGDAANWSLTSGGAGGECIPSPADNVVFDANSFDAPNQEVVIDAEQAFCNTVDWSTATNKPVFSNQPNNASLYIFGSCYLNQNMANNFNGKIIFRSESTGNQIQSNRNIFNADVYFEGDGGSWALLDSMHVESRAIELNKGTLNSNGQKISAKHFISNKIDYDRALVIENSEVDIYDSWEVVNTLFSLNANASHIFMRKTDANMQAGENLAYNNISFTSGQSTQASIGGSQLDINQIYYASEGLFSCSESTVQNIHFEGKGSLNAVDNNFVNAQFNANGFFLFDNAFETLHLTAGNSYTFTKDATQTITTDFIANGDCNAPITLQSDEDGATSNIYKQNSDAIIDYTIMKDIAAVAGENYTANNTTDLGNNPGWIINAVSAKDYYWVGGSGDWDDLSHWSFSSGGPGGAVGACLPSQNDNVYFDNNSFTADGQTVNVGIEKINCKTMDWSQIDDQPVFINNSTSKTFNIFGSLLLSPKLNWLFSGDISFMGNNGNFSINTEEKRMLQNVTFAGDNAVWELLSDFSVAYQLELRQGQLNCTNKTVAAQSFVSNTESPSVLTANNSSIALLNSWDTRQNFTFEGDGSKIGLSNYQAVFSSSASSATNYNVIALTNDNAELVASNSIIKKVEMKQGSVDGGNASIDSLFFAGSAQIKGGLGIHYGRISAGGIIFDSHEFGKMDFYGPVTIYADNEFRTANFYHDATLYGNNSYDTLTFAADHAYVLASYRTQAVNKFIGLEGNSCFKILLESSTASAPAILSLPSGVVEGYALSIKDIEAAGGASFYAAGPSENLGINQGWTFGAPPGYIYGFSSDSIYLAGQTATLTTSNFNTDANTQYNWSTGSTSSSITTDVPGKYTVEVIYNSQPKQCSFTDEINIHFATIKHASCGANGETTITSSPNETYNYLWGDNSTNTMLTSLMAGEYSVEITNATSGEKASRAFTLNGPPELEAEFVLNKMTSCIGGNDGELSASISGGTPPYTQFWQDNANLDVSARTGLAAGTYQLNIADSNHCQNIIIEALVKEPEKMDMDILNLQDLGCFGDNDAALTFSANGGTPPYSCQWDNGEEETEITNLAAGEYSVIVTDANNCELLYDTVVIEHPQELFVDFQTQNPGYADSEDGAIEVIPSGGTFPYSYYLTNQEGETQNYLDALGAGEYILHLEDKNGCQLTDTISLTADYDVKLIIPNSFTPNDDNKNDYFTIKSLAPLQFYKIEIFNRWGQKLFESGNVDNSWDGRYKGKISSPGTYYYHIQYQNREKIEQRKGFLHLFK